MNSSPSKSLKSRSQEDSPSETLDLPFLVTHWLTSYTTNSDPLLKEGNKDTRQERKDIVALEKIRKATAELASAFSELGDFGHTISHNLGHANNQTQSISENTNDANQVVVKHATYTDLTRQWSNVPSTHLHALMQSSTSASNAALSERSKHLAKEPYSIIESAYEMSTSGYPTKTNEEQKSQYDNQAIVIRNSALHNPILFDTSEESVEKLPSKELAKELLGAEAVTTAAKALIKDTNVTIPIGSDFKKLGILTANASRRYLNVKLKFYKEEQELKQLQKSLVFQKHIVSQVNNEISRFISTQSASASASAATGPTQTKEKSDTLTLQKSEADRVIAQLERRKSELKTKHEYQTKSEMHIAHSVSNTFWNESLNVKKSYIDPYDAFSDRNDYTTDCSVSQKRRNAVLSFLTSRSYGTSGEIGGRRRVGVIKRKVGIQPTINALRSRINALLTTRMSHYITINAHLYCPIYCLHFDKTGKYFVTGSDDNLVKVFRLGFPHYEGKRHYNTNKFSQLDKRRGACLVCTLRGHASVITDIDVSADNTLLATASDDGDVRVWGLTDGCPIAILRGHTGGANMVSWSVLTPYRLITVGQDGLARMWDIRKAALKRCRNVRKRVDYLLSASVLKRYEKSDYSTTIENSRNDGVRLALNDSNDIISLPPLPSRAIQSNNAVSESNISRSNISEANRPIQNPINGAVYVPPLPAGAETGVGAQEIAGNNNGGIAVPGAFVANDDIDEGVVLMSKLQHGETTSHSAFQGAGTRSRRKKVNVCCITRCPIGGHFATGSDDGIGRIWADDDDKDLENLDDAFREHNSPFAGKSYTNLILSQIKDSMNRTRSSIPSENMSSSTMNLLADLHGHHKAITDIKYSNEGDRLLTASQKDGVVRIWSWGNDCSSKHASGTTKIEKVRQIFLRMTPPPQCNESTNSTQMLNRRRSSASKSTLQVNCDMAAWTSDDKKIVTSQCCVVTTNSSDIIIGSQIVRVWDSKTGQCLIDLPSIHSKSCPVLISHPLDPSILVSAGLDGFVHVWNLDTGTCLFSHQNIHKYGSVETTNDRGSICGYLDGGFSPDGLILILTDDKGRISLIDTFQAEIDISDSIDEVDGGQSSSKQCIAPLWMQEQYFANDYYELYYDPNGYCIERGSRQPPHLAPEAARCNHIGSAYGAVLQAALTTLPGPSPLLEEEVRLHRDDLRQKSFEVRKPGGILAQNVIGTRTLIESYPNKSTHIIGRGNTELVTPETTTHHTHTSVAPLQPENARPRNRQLSSRYRWIDYDDTTRDDDIVEEVESDYDENENTFAQIDEESDGSPSRNRRNRSQPSARTRRRNNRIETRRENERFEDIVSNEPIRSSARQSARSNSRTSHQYDDEDSDGSIFDEMLSANTSPGGEFITDYTDLGHLFKLPSGGALNREWLSRNSCIESHTGLKTFTPQVGDSVVYIPRAHSDTLVAFPICNNSSTGAPWKTWPNIGHWPVVQCEVKNIRYRFPYNGHYGNKSQNQILSAVAIVTLEITGIPVENPNRQFPWPKPEFIAKPSTRSSTTTFDVSIFESGDADFLFPLSLYLWRVQQLEAAIFRNNNNILGIKVMDIYFDPSKEDATFTPYECTIVTMLSEDDDHDEVHFQGCGYNSIGVQFEENDFSTCSPWDLNISCPDAALPLPSCLTKTQKETMFSILDTIEKDAYVSETFSAPVDTRIYVDYLLMIENPIHISKIRERLQLHYYTNVFSLRSDVKLIVENCNKYNKPDTSVSIEAENMYDSFLSLFEEALRDLDPTPGARDAIESGAFYQNEHNLTSNGCTSNVPIAQNQSTRPERHTNLSNEETTDDDRNEDIDNTDDRNVKLRVTVNKREIPDDDFDSDDDDFDSDDDESSISRSDHESISTHSGEVDHSEDQFSENESRVTRNRKSSAISKKRGVKRKPISPRSTGVQQKKRKSSKYFSNDTNESEPDVLVSSSNRPTRTRSRSKATATYEDDTDSKMSDNTDIDESDIVEPSIKRNREKITSYNPRAARSLEVETSTTRRSTRKRTSHNSHAMDTESVLLGPAKVNGKHQRTNVGRSTMMQHNSDVSEAEAPVSSPGRPARGRRSQVSCTYKEDSSSNLSENDNSIQSPPASTTRRRAPPTKEAETPTRRSTRKRTSHNSHVMDTESVLLGPAKVNGKHQRTNVGRSTNKQYDGDVSEAEAPVSSPGRQARGRRSQGSCTYKEDSSSNLSENDNSIPTLPTSRRSTTTATQRHQRRAPPTKNVETANRASRTRSSPRKQISAQGYQHYSKSKPEEFDRNSRRAKSKRNGKTKSSPKQRANRFKVVDLPTVQKWPANSVKHDQLLDVCTSILDNLVLFDAEGLFHSPVIEQIPDITEKYLEVVEKPMDFSTIRNKQMKKYRIISDLQNDLVLTFKNCCTFNKPSTDFFKYAVDLWNYLDVVYVNALKERNIDIPRGYHH